MELPSSAAARTPVLTQRLFPHVSELQYHEDGVFTRPRRRDAVDVVVSRRRRSRAGKRKLEQDMRKKMLQRAGKLPKPVATVSHEGRGSLSVAGRRRAATKFAEALKDDVARTRQPTITSVQFGPYPDAFAHAFGFWEPGHVKTANSPGG